jgi:ribonuclease HI
VPVSAGTEVRSQLVAKATVITDASWCPHTNAGGWAAWINVNYPGGGHQRLNRSGNFNKLVESSTWAEAYAAWNGIWLAYQMGARDILVQTDCLELVQRNGRPSSVKGASELNCAKEAYWPDARLRWRHVRGHTSGDDRRSWVNNWCDREARKYMRQQRALQSRSKTERYS